MKASVSREDCIGCELCTQIEPDVFRMNSEGFAEAYKEADESNKENVQEAIDACPGSAIGWEEE